MELYQLIVWRDGDHFHGKKADSVGNIVLVKFPVDKVKYDIPRVFLSGSTWDQGCKLVSITNLIFKIFGVMGTSGRVV